MQEIVPPKFGAIGAASRQSFHSEIPLHVRHDAAAARGQRARKKFEIEA
jgi:hypothetical protein